MFCRTLDSCIVRAENSLPLQGAETEVLTGRSSLLYNGIVRDPAGCHKDREQLNILL